jgi:SynChlorMet cassette protein ScmD
VLREEFDDWAVLFNPDTGRGFGLSPTGVYVWKLLDGKHSINEMLEALTRNALNVPVEATDHLIAFVEELSQYGLAAHDVEQMHNGRAYVPHYPAGVRTAKINYDIPKLIDLSGEEPAKGACCSSGTSATGDGCGCFGNCVNLSGSCGVGGCAGNYCSGGTSASFYCTTGTSAYTGCRTGCSGNPNGAICGSGSCAGNSNCSCSGGS